MLRRIWVCVAACIVMTGVAGAPVRAAPPPPGAQGSKGALTWGDNSHGQLGDGTLSSRAEPVEPFGLHAGVRQVSAGGRHTVALLDGERWSPGAATATASWGTGTLDTHLLPLRVSGLGSVVQVSAGGHTRWRWPGMARCGRG